MHGITSRAHISIKSLFFFLHITQNINGSEALKKSIGGENGDHGVQNLNKRTNDFNITN